MLAAATPVRFLAELTFCLLARRTPRERCLRKSRSCCEKLCISTFEADTSSSSLEKFCVRRRTIPRSAGKIARILNVVRNTIRPGTKVQMARDIQGDSRILGIWNSFKITGLMKNCLIQKLSGFEGGKIRRVNFSRVLRGFEIPKVIFISFNWTIYFF